MFLWFLFFLAFLSGIGFGYMRYHINLRDVNFHVKINGKEYKLKFKSKRSESWDDDCGIGRIVYEYIELEEKKEV